VGASLPQVLIRISQSKISFFFFFENGARACQKWHSFFIFAPLAIPGHKPGTPSQAGCLSYFLTPSPQKTDDYFSLLFLKNTAIAMGWLCFMFEILQIKGYL